MVLFETYLMNNMSIKQSTIFDAKLAIFWCKYGAYLMQILLVNKCILIKKRAQKIDGAYKLNTLVPASSGTVLAPIFCSIKAKCQFGLYLVPI